jgi:hypothetical protein
MMFCKFYKTEVEETETKCVYCLVLGVLTANASLPGVIMITSVMVIITRAKLFKRHYDSPHNHSTFNTWMCPGVLCCTRDI